VVNRDREEYPVEVQSYETNKRISLEVVGVIVTSRLATTFFWAAMIFFVAIAIITTIGLLRIFVLGQAAPENFWYVFGLAIAEPVGLLYAWIKDVSGLRSGNAKKMRFDTQAKINSYMKNLVKTGTSVDIVSGRLSWVSSDDSVRNTIIEHSRRAAVNIFLPSENQIAKELRENGVNVNIVTMLSTPPKARFTLLNKDRPGSGLLAVGYGIIPRFEIVEFSESHYPQIIALARDYIQVLIALGLTSWQKWYLRKTFVQSGIESPRKGIVKSSQALTSLITEC
jgi:hypothetical protein